jgi:ATP-dependent Clp protease ATP-binding subunit ClpA
MAEAIRLRFDDLVSAGRRGRLLHVVGRETELRRMARTLGRRSRNGVLVAGPPGVGKTALVEGFAAFAAQTENRRVLGIATPQLPIIRLDTEQCVHLFTHSPLQAHRVLRALRALPPCIVVIDELGLFMNARDEARQFERILSPFLQHPKCSLSCCGKIRRNEYPFRIL